uniref:Secreted protein n=1 Tax=Utricularia reniformis TaxID=192314 RepID=A0A1Y0B0V4_9LAMI|nr:hypothetical protein AEK19_MT0774 [Utricularia reniformis]ART31017.1 hypothetical protein AEK19_MT0774 [Utricularia reniformis]
MARCFLVPALAMWMLETEAVHESATFESKRFSPGSISLIRSRGIYCFPCSKAFNKEFVGMLSTCCDERCLSLINILSF